MPTGPSVDSGDDAPAAVGGVDAEIPGGLDVATAPPDAGRGVGVARWVAVATGTRDAPGASVRTGAGVTMGASVTTGAGVWTGADVTTGVGVTTGPGVGVAFFCCPGLAVGTGVGAAGGWVGFGLAARTGPAGTSTTTARSVIAMT